MKRLPLLALLVLIGVADLGAQARTLVPIVRPVLHEETAAFLGKLADTMFSEGYTDAADYLRAWAKSGFGSGFVYVDARDGRNYVLTNKHVVDQAESVVLEFEREDGSTVSYKACPILAISETLDLALIGFPDDAKPFGKGFGFAGLLPVDGADVWSAGYPGLLSRPSWQFGKGSVTNAKARVPELADPALTDLIQHSAPIDPGSSGGPLLVADAKAALGYAVAGINTWKVGGRQDVNFAIPAKALSAFIEAASAPSDKDPRAELAARADAFVLAANAGPDAYKSLARFVSYDFVAKEGGRILRETLESAPSSVRGEIVDVFVGVSPVEGLRLSIAYALSRAVAADEGARLSFQGVVSLVDGSGNVSLGRGSAKFEAPWVREHGFWRLQAFPPLETKSAIGGEKAKSDPSALELVSPYDIGFSVGGSVELGGAGLKAGYLGLSMDVLDTYFLLFSMDMSLMRYDYESTDYFEPGQKTGFALSPFVSAMAQLPLKFDDLYVVPYAKGGLGFMLSLGLDAPLSGGLSGLGGGLYVRLPGASWCLGAEYLGKRYYDIEAAISGGSDPQDMHAVAVYLTFGAH